jgi:hypothetical protein
MILLGEWGIAGRLGPPGEKRVTFGVPVVLGAGLAQAELEALGFPARGGRPFARLGQPCLASGQGLCSTPLGVASRTRRRTDSA